MCQIILGMHRPKLYLFSTESTDYPLVVGLFVDLLVNHGHNFTRNIGFSLVLLI